MNIRIATRGSRLALCQSEIVRKKIMSLDPSARCELVIVRTAAAAIFRACFSANAINVLASPRR